MSGADWAGMIGAALILGAFGAVQLRVLEATRAPALLVNLAGAVLTLVSLSRAFNLAATVVEGAWALIALAGLIRLIVRRP